MPRLPWSRLRPPLLWVAGLSAMVLLLAWLMGAFRDRVPPGPPQRRVERAPDGPRHTVVAAEVPRFETAIGTIRAVRETSVAARILGRVKSLAIERAGQVVQQGDVLVELESSDLQALAEQARASLRVAETRRDKLKVDLDRSETLVRQGIAAPDRLDTDRAAFTAAAAEVERAQQQVRGADSALAFATVRAPIAGIVVDKLVNLGDVVQPGQPICTIYDPTRLQLVAVVREELAGRLAIGQPVTVTIEALGKDCEGVVAEIVPAAQVQSRAFEVKVTGPCQPGIVTGMFGRLRVPLGMETQLRVPTGSVQQVGQLDFVHVVGAGDVVERRFVRTGRVAGGEVEVLAGLAAGEVVLAAPAGR